MLLLHATMTKGMSLLLMPSLIEMCLLLKRNIQLPMPKAGILLHHGSQLGIGVTHLLLLVNNSIGLRCCCNLPGDDSSGVREGLR